MPLSGYLGYPSSLSRLIEMLYRVKLSAKWVSDLSACRTAVNGLKLELYDAMSSANEAIETSG